MRQVIFWGNIINCSWLTILISQQPAAMNGIYTLALWWCKGLTISGILWWDGGVCYRRTFSLITPLTTCRKWSLQTLLLLRLSVPAKSSISKMFGWCSSYPDSSFDLQDVCVERNTQTLCGWFMVTDAFSCFSLLLITTTGMGTG